MTVSSTTTKNSYSGNGSTTTFAYGFKIFANTDLTVILRAATGAETVQTLTTHYTVTNVGVDTGGNVVFGSAPASGVTVVIRRNMALTQSTDYVANDPFPAATHEDALDRLTFISQQMQEESDRSIKLSRTNTMTSTEFTTSAADRANKILAFDTSGELAVTQELGTYKGTDTTTTTAAYTVRDIIKSTTAGQLNNVYICIAISVIGDTLTDTDHFELLVDAVSAAASATTATTQAGIATTKASEALSSANTAEGHKDDAETAKGAAETAQGAAETAQGAAETAQAAAETALDNFDDIFLGAKSSDPSTDNDGDALTAGDLYFNTTSSVLKVYTGSAWTTISSFTTGISNTNIPVFTSGVADDDFLRVAGTSIEGRSASELLSDIGASAVAGSSSIVTTGALNAGSITSGFGAIDNGASAITTTGVGSFGSLDISGDIDVDGTTNLDVVDIDGAVDMASTALVTGVLTANGGAVFNEGGADVDFRVESDTLTHALFVNGADGKIGIGESSPNAGLQITSTNNDINKIRLAYANTTHYMEIGRQAGFYRIASFEDGQALTFGTSTTAGATTERMRIDSSGYIYVNTSGVEPSGSQVGVRITGTQGQNFWKSANSGTGGYNHLTFFNGNGEVGSIVTASSATAYNTSSDYRLKENVTADWDATTRLKQLNPVRFNFIADADTTVDGFLAHEVSNVVPEAITGTKDEVEVWKDGEELPDGVSVGDNKLDDDGNTIPDYQGIDQSKLVPLLVKTIQELEARITALEGA